MGIRLTSRNVDVVMVIDAILISLACLLVILAYREITQAPIRYAHSLADAISAVTDDFSVDESLSGGAFDENGLLQLEQRYDSAANKVRQMGDGSQILLYSEHPLFAELGVQADEFRKNAWSSFQAGQSGRMETIAEMGDKRFLRIALPWFALRDCDRCEAAGLPTFEKGDVIGLREISTPITDQYAQAISRLLAALGMLATALMVFLGLLMPIFKRSRAERAQISTLAQTLEKEATTDPLTKLHNRRYFEKALTSFLEEFQQMNKPLGLLILDLDHFKQINDNFGHDAGDYVLKEIALRLKSITRDNDIVARIGGEEFAVITPFASPQQLMGIAERYRRSIESLKIEIGNTSLKPTISIGVATNSSGHETVDDLFRAADMKLYEAKRGGRNQVAA